ncbi:accessory Sec system translocase SecY2 [Staphylococcus warneri L37603]|jgi:preprotein translocase subunit SecY|uniref:accessory Sec system protein translocase subunit SecY2 n=1 Tax=Staphylococcus warneri TaxID=1292 RepID=UPI0001A5CD3A|nr:accessory Sec system protein translocase subunit SecY2 [Staphylococcus warneri]EEQ81022.1 accessory Sec system translocase SecY2 [Staphylococcus warneri L37603]QKI07806.1 accessory Sec system protein translocase subunit SecY2 [Staphylococcus warneri]
MNIKNIKNIEYKILYKRILFTLMIIFIYILGSNIKIADMKSSAQHTNQFLDLAISNVGGDITTLNLFSLGLSPWLTTMIIMTLLTYRNMEKGQKQTRLERSYKERFFTILLALIQGYFILSEYINKGMIHHANFPLMLLILVAGTMLLVWLADQNTVYGIAGPTPIVLVSIIKSMFQNKHLQLLDAQTMVIGGIMILVVLILLLFIEMIEYRMIYRDIMNISTSKKDTYVSWKLNPAGSISIMFNFSLFFLLGVLIHLIGRWITGDTQYRPPFLELDNPIGVLIFIIMLIILNYYLSRVMLNTKRIAKDFQKSGNYFDGIYPGDDTRHYLDRRAKKISAIGALIIGFIISLPLISSIFISGIYDQISIFTQFIILIYITINITETIRTYLYFDKYKSFLNKYW